MQQVAVEQYILPSEVRWHPTPVYVWEALGARMRVEEHIRKSVVFLGHEGERGFSPYGTGLLGLIRFDEDTGNTIIVSADHVIESIPGDEVSIRVNRRDGSSSVTKASKRAKVSFKDKAVDLCIFPITLDPTVYDIHAMPLESPLWEEWLRLYGEPGQGDEVCIVGLYTTHFGHIRNIPVARIGHIAAMPEEKVMTDRGYITGYLIEVHSIAGLSGSPVYWNVPAVRIRDGQIYHLHHPAYIPLGVLIGYHVIETREDEIVVPQFQELPETREYGEPSSHRTEERRTGFAVVLPIQHIFGVFESEVMKDILRKGRDEGRKKSGYRPASASPLGEIVPPAADENPSHREDFNSLLSAAVKKPAQED